MSIAVIGAGIAGLTAAYTLRRDVVIFEKSRGLGGRAATRWYDRPSGRVYVDHGTQYLKSETEAFHRFLLEILPREDLNDIALPVWTFDARNQISEGDPIHNSTPKWSYKHGLSTLGRLLANAGALDVRLKVRIGALRLEDNGSYTLIDTDGHTVGAFEQVIVAIPAGQAADLIAASALPTEKQALEAALRQGIYRRCLSIVLGYDRPLLNRPYYALVNTDKAHDISWLGYEHRKAGHAPANHSALVIQMAGPFSLDRWEMDTESLVRMVAELASNLLAEDLTAFDWADVQKWRYSQPDQLVSAAKLNGILPNLWFAGDYLVGGRVHLAAENGVSVAESILQTV